MKIFLHPELHCYTSRQGELTIDGVTLGQCLSGLFDRFPQLLVFLQADHGREAECTSFIINGTYVWDRADLWRSVGPDDVLELERDLPEGAKSSTQLLIGAVLFVGGLYFGYPNAALLGASFVLGAIGSSIAGDPLLPSNGTLDSTSNTYSFSGIKNSTVAGTPIPVCYGRHRVGGHLVSLSDKVAGNTMWVRALIGLSEGPIEELLPDTLEINARNKKEYSQKYVEAFWRRGTENQHPNRGGDGGVLVSLKDQEYTGDYVLGFCARVFYTLLETTTIPSYLVDPKDSRATLDAFVTFVGTWLNPAAQVRVTGATGDHLIIRHVWPTPPSGKGEGYDPHYTVAGALVYYGPSGSTNYSEFRLLDKYVFDAYISYNNFRTDSPAMVLPAGVHDYIIVNQTTTGYTKYNPNGAPFVSYYFTSDNKIIVKGVTYTSSDSEEPEISGYATSEITTSYNNFIPYPTDANGNAIVVNADLMNTSQGITTITTSGVVDGLEVDISAPLMYTESGTKDAAVNFKIFYAREGELFTDANSLALTFGPYLKKQEVIFNVPLPISKLGSAVYKLKIARTTAYNPNDFKTENRLYLKNITEIVNEKMCYPYTALLAVNIEAHEQISGSIPNLTIEMKGRRVRVPTGYDGANRYLSGVWNGTMTEETVWTDNPVWCLYDLLTNPRYGLNEFFNVSAAKHQGLMLANFVEMAKICDERLAIDGTVTTAAATTSRYDTSGADLCRYSLNLVLDESKTVLEWASVICSVMRAAWYYYDGCFYLDIDRDKKMTQLFTMSSIKDFTETGASVKAIPNSYEVQYVSQVNNYKYDMFLLEDESVQRNSAVEERRKTLRVVGITDEKQATRLARYALLSGARRTRSVSFSTGTQGLVATVGDIIGVQHDATQWGLGSRIAAVTDSGSSYTLTLRDELDLSLVAGPSSSYQAAVARNGGSPQLVPLAGELTDPLQVVIAKVALDNTGVQPQPGDVLVIGTASNVVKPFKITAIKRTSDELTEITAWEHDPYLYGDADNLTGITVSRAPASYALIEGAVRVSVTGLTALTTRTIDASGAVHAGIEVWYTAPASSFWKGAVIKYGTALTTLTELSIDATGHVAVPDVLSSGTYYVVACSVYADGTRQTTDEALSDTLAVPYRQVAVTVGTSILSSGQHKVANLRIENTAVPGQFTGRDCRIAWDPLDLYDIPTLGSGSVAVTAGSTQVTGTGTAFTGSFTTGRVILIEGVSYQVFAVTSNTILQLVEPCQTTGSTLPYRYYSNNGNTANQLLAAYTVTVKSAEGATVRRTTNVTDTFFVYTYEMNKDDGVSRTFRVEVRAVDIYGQASDVALIVCTNLAPPALV